MPSDKALINISTWDGTITSTDFYVAASNFAEQWNNLDLGFPHWSWINCPKGPLFAASKVCLCAIALYMLSACYIYIY